MISKQHHHHLLQRTVQQGSMTRLKLIECHHPALAEAALTDVSPLEVSEHSR